ncbi:ABC transporter permease subunit [Alkalibaculum sp. M08DMB]|uniref:ABC transporter permease subunit n=1 Tax=Alkalibaculum sporogenes TaxID=2655001 RepID=A0A6A7K5B9_9FIRM|nr:amino acid ABC transporter permease [Alkalibaculum sporogenes]MPW24646.1 ABC transporter permease subunit [Alkalibaculum sporogenes]
MSYIMEIMPLMMQGLRTTIWVFVFTGLLSIPLGMIICTLRLSKSKILQGTMQLYILIVRGTPLLLQLIFVFFGLVYVGIVLDRGTAVLIAFTLNYAAYFAEIFRGGVMSISEGQYEASKVLGLSKRDTYFGVILPQVFKRVLPPVGNELITLVKDTSLVYVLGLGDVIRAAKTLSNTQASLMPIVVAGVIYLVLIAIVTYLLRRTEIKYNYYR